MEFLDSGGAVAKDDEALGQGPNDEKAALGQPADTDDDPDEADVETKSVASSGGAITALPVVMRGK
eukprot:1463617-Lingulodinium_polyedra.AAC.1